MMNAKAARQRQKALRDANRSARRPERDDLARVALYWLIRRAIEKDQEAELGKFQDVIVSMLSDQGFDEGECDRVFNDLVSKYRSGGLPFRRKLHLLYPDGVDQDV
ncbi:conserved hypothetical protein [Agrobacterium tumefaciens str. Kerr 14]|uniref:Uncharacterized protein n=1 Tax=Agrobacterium tumefaciens str. Kerr 14 TaxID=1183424 RepID=A0A1S7S1M2_AGRTU|nr:hypothetical protein [Agrobacterium tumefaciens]CUX61219.1 conserved hypothetical protein [Agrobacterium tumefaciens str. Kerr 14]